MSIEAAKEELRPKLGKEIYVGQWLKITQEMIDQFATLTGDTQWIHTDSERATSESPYGRTIAHGFMTLSLITLLTERIDPEKDIVSGVTIALNYGVNRVRFPAAVPVEARVRARTTLQNVEEDKGGLRVTENVVVEIEGQDRPGCVAEMITLLFFE
jgi:acyl dehydratase